MRRSRLARVARMGRAELAWRTAAAARIAADRARASLRDPSWDRSALARILTRTPETAPIRKAARAAAWADAHRHLAHHIAAAPPRFVIAPAMRAGLSTRVRREFPSSAREAAARGDRILNGEYDLLGYRGLRFVAPDAPDWHYDPVNEQRAPVTFWSTVPYLHASCGDHKIIWELNRHQHWLTLGRAYWLTDDARYRSRALDELAGWLDANPPLLGINWASMLELALRSISWIWAVQLFADARVPDDRPWLVDLLVALDRQLLHVERNLSYYFSPNTHLLGEALALYVAGHALPLLAGSPRRRALGRKILVAEIARQIAADGGHCERSTHYHRYTLDFYILALCVARIARDPAAADFERAVARLGFAARLLADDHGRLPHIGDDDGGMTFPLAGRACDDIGDSLATASALVGREDLAVGGSHEEMLWMLSHPAFDDLHAGAPPTREPDRMTSAALPDTGYYVSRSPGLDHIVIDGGAHGYQNGGHAHADALSLTATLRGVPLLIDPGTGCYTTNPGLRDRLRGTSAHNTVSIDGQPQSTPHGPFHWAQTTDAVTRRWRTNAGFDYFEGAHDGYRPLEHRRHVLVLPGDLLLVADLVAGAGARRADVHWHIDGRWDVSRTGRRATLTSAGEQAELVIADGLMEVFRADEATGLGWNAPVYGVLEPARSVRISMNRQAPMWIVSVFGFDPANPVLEVETLPVWAEAGALQHAVGVRVARTRTVDSLLLADPAEHRGTWRLGDLETDGRVLLCRATREGPFTRVALVDGSLVRSSGRRKLLLTLPREVPDVHLDLGGDGGQNVIARLSGPAFGARVQVGGQDVPIETERRAAAYRMTR